MKKLFNYLVSKNLLTCFFGSYIIILMMNAIKTLLSFVIGGGDVFFKIFSFMSDYLDPLSKKFLTMLSWFSFVGSFYSVVVYPLLWLLWLSVYGMLIHSILYIALKDKPKRFSVTLSIIYASAATVYVLKVIPWLGQLLFVIGFVYFFSTALAKKNKISNAKGVFIVLLPFIALASFFVALVFSIIGMASFF